MRFSQWFGPILIVSMMCCGSSSPQNCSVASSAGNAVQGSDAAFTYTTETTAAPERVWAVWMDVAGWPRWDTALLQARAQAPLALEVAGTLVSRGSPDADFRVTVFDDGTRYAFETALPMAALTVTRELARGPAGGTRFTHRVAFTGERGAEFAALFGPGFRAALPGAVEGVARLAEGCGELKP